MSKLTLSASFWILKSKASKSEANSAVKTGLYAAKAQAVQSVLNLLKSSKLKTFSPTTRTEEDTTTTKKSETPEVTPTQMIPQLQ